MFTPGQVYGCLRCGRRVYRPRAALAIRSICEGKRGLEEDHKWVWIWRISWKPRWW